MGDMVSGVESREVRREDLDVFFQNEHDEEARQMAAFGSKNPGDWEAFGHLWQRMLNDPTVWMRTTLVDGQVAGNICKFDLQGEPAVAYWLGRQFWGRGIATQALKLLLTEVKERPLYARAAKDNFASVRVLEKCGFQKAGEETNFAAARGVDTLEVIMRLD